jgi:hypothetical protein
MLDFPTTLAGRPRGRQFAAAPILAIAAVFLVLALGPATSASAATGAAAASARGIVTHYGGGTLTVPSGQTVSSVFAIGGKVVIAGTVRHTVVGVGTKVVLQRGAVVGAAHSSGDTSLVLIGGSLTKPAGAAVTGRTTTISSSQVTAAWQAAVVAPISHVFGTLSLIIWGALTILYVLLAVVLAALAPRQLAAVGRRITARPLPTAGWGLLIAIVIVPVVTVLLVASIIGLLALAPWGVVVLAVYVMGAVAIAALLGEALMRRLGGRVGLVVATLIGVVVIRLVELIPYVGSVVSALLAILAFGAAAMAFWDWRRGSGGAASVRLSGRETTGAESERRAA